MVKFVVLNFLCSWSSHVRKYMSHRTVSLKTSRMNVILQHDRNNLLEKQIHTILVKKTTTKKKTCHAGLF